MGRPNAMQMQPMPGSFPGSQVSMSGPSFGALAGAGLTSLSGPALGQAAPPSGASGPGMSHSGLPGGRRMYPGHAPPSPVESQPSAGPMGMPSHTVSLGSTVHATSNRVCHEHGISVLLLVKNFHGLLTFSTLVLTCTKLKHSLPSGTVETRCLLN